MNVKDEIKGREREDVELKTQAVIKAGYEIQVITNKDIAPIIKSLQNKYQLKDLTELYDKRIMMNLDDIKNQQEAEEIFEDRIKDINNADCEIDISKPLSAEQVLAMIEAFDKKNIIQ